MTKLVWLVSALCAGLGLLLLVGCAPTGLYTFKGAQVRRVLRVQERVAVTSQEAARPVCAKPKQDIEPDVWRLCKTVTQQNRVTLDMVEATHDALDAAEAAGGTAVDWSKVLEVGMGTLGKLLDLMTQR